MMFADLVDEVDLKERIEALGVVLQDGASPAECIQIAQLQKVEGFDALVEQLLSEPGLLQPEVREALLGVKLP